MKRFGNQTALLDSWRQCARSGLSPNAPEDKLYPLSTEKLQQLCQERQLEIAAFRHIMSGTQMPKGSVSILTDARGILLEKKFP